AMFPTQPPTAHSGHSGSAMRVARSSWSCGGDLYSKLNPGDMIRITGGKVQMHSGRLQLSINARRAQLTRFGEDQMPFKDRPFLSHLHWEEGDNGAWHSTGELAFHHWSDMPQGQHGAPSQRFGHRSGGWGGRGGSFGSKGGESNPKRQRH
ncbi:hypothetical protein BC831DRAFT_481205, partial [Entophlyctis helioformis]